MRRILLSKNGITCYNGLLRAVKAALSAGLVNVQKTLEYQRVRTYWTIGKKILQSVELSQGALTLNEALYERISADIDRQLGLELTLDTIRRSIQFSKAYPKFPDKTPLTFTHYLALMRVPDVKKRSRLERQAIKDEMSSYELKEKILQLNTSPAVFIDKSTKALKIERGEPYVYRARLFEDLNGREDMCVDCGFKIQVPIDGVIVKCTASFSKDRSRCVRVIKEAGNYDVRLAVRKRGLIYTYAARVSRVVDGDTIDAIIDVGFRIRVHERLRLKAINAPEIKTRAGQKSRQFLTGYLAKCPVIVMRTSKAGMYGRWLADIFTLDKCRDPYRIAREGTYLNQLLLDERFARVY